MLRTDNDGGMTGRYPGLCSEHSIRQEFTPSDRAQCNGVVERAIALIDKGNFGGHPRNTVRDLRDNSSVGDQDNIPSTGESWDNTST